MGQKKILIVDDERKIRDMLVEILSSAGYMAVFAEDGEEGVKQAKAHLPDLILMDVMMPKMAGGEAVRCLGEDPATKDIPVIFITSIITKEEEESQEFGIQLSMGKRRFIAKPFEPQKLLAEIKEALEGQG